MRRLVARLFEFFPPSPDLQCSRARAGYSSGALQLSRRSSTGCVLRSETVFEVFKKFQKTTR